MKVFIEMMLMASQMYFFVKALNNSKSNVPLLMSSIGILSMATLFRYYL